MKAGDLVKCDSWVYGGRTGVIIRIQDVTHCVGAYVLLDDGVRLVRLDNIKVIE